MESYSSPEIFQIMQNPNNQRCIDCDSQNPKWVSINNAVFICSKCARNHQLLGKNISTIKSLEVDNFSQDEILLLNLGGNLRFDSLMKENEISITSSVNHEFKYHLNIAEYYRNLWICEWNKNSNPEAYQQVLQMKPEPEVGLQLMNSVNAQSIADAENRSAQQSELQKDIGAVVNTITGLFSKIGGVIGEQMHKMGIDTKLQEVGNKITGKYSQIEENHPTWKATNEKGKEIAKNTGDFIADTSKKVYNSDLIQKLSKGAENQYVFLKTKAKELIGKGANNNGSNTTSNAEVPAAEMESPIELGSMNTPNNQI